MTVVNAFFLIMAVSSDLNSVSNGGSSQGPTLESYLDSWESFVVACLRAAPVKTNAGEWTHVEKPAVLDFRSKIFSAVDDW